MKFKHGWFNKEDFKIKPRYIYKLGNWPNKPDECDHPLSWQTWGNCEGCGRYDTEWLK